MWSATFTHAMRYVARDKLASSTCYTACCGMSRRSWPFLRGVVLQWFRSYLTGRTFQVIYAGSKSSVVIICCSVPQGSVLGPRMFILYMADLEDAVAAHDVRLHAYADDTQLYLKCQAQEATAAAHTLEACITDVTAWMK